MNYIFHNDIAFSKRQDVAKFIFLYFVDFFTVRIALLISYWYNNDNVYNGW